MGPSIACDEMGTVPYALPPWGPPAAAARALAGKAAVLLF